MKKSAKILLTGKARKTMLSRIPFGASKKRTTMKTKAHKPKAVTQEQLAALLEEAMKQPGVKVAMDVFESSERYAEGIARHANYTGLIRFPSFSSSCSAASLA